MWEEPALTLNGVDYRLYEEPDVDAWREYTEPGVAQLPDVPGSSRPGRSVRPEVLAHRKDDWSGGEGQEFLDTSDDESFKKYFYNSTGSVDVSTPGSISLGFAVSSFAIPTTRFYGPYLAFSRSVVSFMVDENFFVEGPIGTWTDKGSVAATAGNRVSGPMEAHGGYIYVTFDDGTAAFNSARIRRLLWDGTTLTQETFQVSARMEQALAADNRFWSTHDDGGKLLLRRSALSGVLPLAFTDVYTVDNVGSETGLGAIGPRIYVASQYAGEEPRIHIWDEIEQKGAERIKLPVGFRMDTTPYTGLSILGDIVFTGGYRAGTTGFPELPMLTYVSGGRSRTVGVIREDIYSDAHRILTQAPTFQNRLLMGTNKGHVYVYDIAQGGFSQFISGITEDHDITSIIFADGRYYIGSRAASSGSAQNTLIWTTTPTGAGKHPTSAKVLDSKYDYGFPKLRKLITTIRVNTKPLAVGCAVDIELVLDDDTTVTTDVNGASMRHSGTGATSTEFKVSGISSAGAIVSRTCFVKQVNFTMFNSVGGGDTGSSPTVRSIETDALGAEDVHLLDIVVSLEDDTSTNRLLGMQQLGEQKAENLRTLKKLNPKVPVLFVPHYQTGGADGVTGTIDRTHAVIVEEADLRLDRRGNGFAKVRLRDLGEI